jgi:hypothetical protein
MLACRRSAVACFTRHAGPAQADLETSTWKTRELPVELVQISSVRLKPHKAAGVSNSGVLEKTIEPDMKVDTMKRIMSALAIASTMFVVPAFAQADKSPAAKPDVSSPSGQNSGAGIQGYPGNKNGPPANQGTVGSSSANNPTVKDQDAANIKGLPGNKSGPPAKKP